MIKTKAVTCSFAEMGFILRSNCMTKKIETQRLKFDIENRYSGTQSSMKRKEMVSYDRNVIPRMCFEPPSVHGLSKGFCEVMIYIKGGNEVRSNGRPFNSQN